MSSLFEGLCHVETHAQFESFFFITFSEGEGNITVTLIFRLSAQQPKIHIKKIEGMNL